MTASLYAKKAGESALLWSCGDVLAQYVSETWAPDDKKKGAGKWYDPIRTARSAAFAATVYTPLAVTWYGWVSRTIPGASMKDIVAKVGLDQAIFGPMLCSSFFLVMPMFEGNPPQVQRWKENIMPTLIRNWQVWSFVGLFNFAIVKNPVHIVLVCNCVSIPWSSYLAYTNAQAAQAEAKSPTTKQ